MSEEKSTTEDTVTFEEFISTEATDLKPEENVDLHQTSYMELSADPADEGATYVEMGPSGAVTETVYVSEPLPEGYTMVLGDDGQQYVTIVQDNQTYAIPMAGN